MGWIKVSDRKPKNKDEILITYQDLREDGTTKRYMDNATYHADDDTFYVWDSYSQDSYPEYNVIAWMPIPEPYDGN